MLVGIDFDNTIVCYDRLFHQVALERGVIDAEIPANKTRIRDHLRGAGKEALWTEIQGYVYGARMQEATAFDGVAEFFTACRTANIPLAIVSHKTRHPYAGPKYDLHGAARDWLISRPYLDADWISERAFFELTLEAKLNRIASLRCTHFIDDLPEFLLSENFPCDTKRILFDSANRMAGSDWRYARCCSWSDLLATIQYEPRT